MKTKLDIENKIQYIRQQAVNFEKTDIIHSAVWYRRFDELMQSFLQEVHATPLFEQLEPGWFYDIYIDYDGIWLQLQHQTVKDDGDDINAVTDASFTLIHTNLQYYTVTQYCEAYGIPEVTLRQQIRRGKFPSARKIDGEWQIPQLSDFKRRGYGDASYQIEDKLNCPPDLSYLCDVSVVEIQQDKTDKSSFIIDLYKEDCIEKFKTLILTSKDKERLELYLISHPDARYIPNPEDGIIWKLANSTPTD